jgi:hypothetical protein
MLDPFPLPSELIPSTFLPHLPRSQSTLGHLRVPDVLSHIAVLRELYLPPIHGGFQASDVYDEDNNGDRASSRERRQKERRWSAGLSETMGGSGLGLELEGTEAGGPSNGLSKAPLQGVVEEDSDLDFAGEEFDEIEEEIPVAHLDPFEREWAQKWLGGVVRRAQTFLEEQEGVEDGGEELAAQVKQMEAVLRDATAVFAMMAGTSGEVDVVCRTPAES